MSVAISGASGQLGRLTAAHAPERVGSDPSVLVTQLNPLEEEGFISRERDPSDRRRQAAGDSICEERP